jgi:predicted metal-dependent hydrolase
LKTGAWCAPGFGVDQGKPQAFQLPLWSEREPSHYWSLRESVRARRLTVRVLAGGRVEVVVPPRTSMRRVTQFLEKHRAWIERKRAEARHHCADDAFPPRSVEFPASDERWNVAVAAGHGRARVLVRAPGELSLVGRVEEAANARGALRAWLMDHSRARLGSALATCAAELGFTYGRSIVRRQRTRWGSCSTRGTISLNCCLLFQPPQVVRYLFVHELAHTRHMNHSPRFWECVARHCPDYEQLDRQLLAGWRRVPSWVFADLP